MPKKIGYISTNKEIAAFIIGAIEKSFKLYSLRFNQVKTQFSEESVHDVRVSIRRMLALVNLIYAVLPNKNLKSVIKILVKQVGMFSPLRDTQVMMLKVKKMTKEYPILGIFYTHLQARESRLIIKLKHKLSNLDFVDIEGLVFFHRYYLKSRVDKLDVKFSDFVTAANDHYLQVLTRYEDSIRSDMRSVHKTRLGFKRFRYTMEILGPYLNLKHDYYMNLKSFQTVMGSIQDNNVFVDSIETFFRHKPYLPHGEINNALGFLLKERQDLLDKYFGKAETLKAFWQDDFIKDKTTIIKDPVPESN
jgi:CHAD domain-containing protein